MDSWFSEVKYLQLESLRFKFSGFVKLNTYRVCASSFVLPIRIFNIKLVIWGILFVKSLTWGWRQEFSWRYAVGLQAGKTVDLDLKHGSPGKAGWCWLMVSVYGLQWVASFSKGGRGILFVQKNTWMYNVKLDVVVGHRSKEKASVDEIADPIHP